MIASRVRRVLTHALNQIAPVSGYPGRMLALLRKTPAHNGFPFTQERRDLMERAREQLTLLGFAPFQDRRYARLPLPIACRIY